MEGEALSFVVLVVGIALGIVFRTYAPYLKRAIESEQPLKFDRKYLWTAIVAFVIALMSAVDLVAMRGDTATENILLLFALSVLYGATWNSAINRFLWK
jgi:hypothetical protein